MAVFVSGEKRIIGGEGRGWDEKGGEKERRGDERGGEKRRGQRVMEKRRDRKGEGR